MNSGSVKGVYSVLNLLGSQTGRTANADSKGGAGFGDIMNKAAADANKAAGHKEIQASGLKKPEEAKKPGTESGSSKVKDQVSETENERTNELKESGPGSEKAIQEEASKLVKELAEKLGLTEEEVLKTMEELGISLFSLFQPEILTQLLVNLSGESDSLALLTNGELYQTLQELMQSMESAKAALLEKLGVTEEEFSAITKELSEKNLQEEGFILPEDGVSDDEAGEQALLAGKDGTGKITVTAEHGAEKTEAFADGSGKSGQTEGALTRPETEGEAGKESGRNRDGAFYTGNGREEGPGSGQALQALAENGVKAMEEALSQAKAPYSSQETRQIMNQIMDYMRLQLRPGMDQLEMQLHPESLGKLLVQITAKAGEVTAQFHVQNEAVKAVVESQLMDLKEALREQGVKVEAVEVTVESHAFESNLWQGKERDNNAAYGQNKKSPRRINLNALEEGFEEEASEEELLAAKLMEVNGNTVDYTA